ncbi:MAG: hypothetical protein O3B75_06620 [Planctomycetota bacterium]|nr:hypothetical protein [Planctomycetota bacterium]
MPDDMVAHWRPLPSLRISFRSLLCLGGVGVTGNSGTVPGDSHGDFEIAFVTAASVRSIAV